MNKNLLSAIALHNEGYNVHFQLGSDRLTAISIAPHTTYVTCTIRLVHRPKKGACVLRIDSHDGELLIGVDEQSDKVWLIPVADVHGLRCIRLGKRWDSYKRIVKVYKTGDVGLAFDNLKASAVSAARSVNAARRPLQ